MDQPFIKFMGCTSAYLIFIILIIAKTLRVDISQSEKFSAIFPEHKETFSKYVLNESFRYRYYTQDFFIRQTRVSSVDYLCCFWIVGKISSIIKT